MIPDFPYNIRIRLAQLDFFLRPDVAKSLPCVAFLNRDSQQGRDLATSGCNKKSMGPIFFYTMRKVWYHQIWIQNYFSFIVLILMYVAFEIGLNMSFEPIVHTRFYACSKPFDAHSKPRENGLSMTIIQMCIYLNVRVC